MALGCALGEPLMGKIECLAAKVMAKAKPSGSGSPEALVSQTPLALVYFYWGNWKGDAVASAFAERFARRLKEYFLVNSAPFSQLEKVFGVPGIDAVLEFMATCMKKGVVFPKEDTVLLTQFFGITCAARLPPQLVSQKGRI